MSGSYLLLPVVAMLSGCQFQHSFPIVRTEHLRPERGVPGPSNYPQNGISPTITFEGPGTEVGNQRIFPGGPFVTAGFDSIERSPLAILVQAVPRKGTEESSSSFHSLHGNHRHLLNSFNSLLHGNHRHWLNKRMRLLGNNYFDELLASPRKVRSKAMPFPVWPCLAYGPVRD